MQTSVRLVRFGRRVGRFLRVVGERLVRVTLRLERWGQLDPKCCKKLDPILPVTVRCRSCGQAVANGRNMAVAALVAADSLLLQPLTGGMVSVRVVMLRRAGPMLEMKALVAAA